MYYYSEHESVAIVIQHTKCMHHIDICGLFSSTIFFHIISKMAPSLEKILNIKCVFCLPV